MTQPTRTLMSRRGHLALTIADLRAALSSLTHFQEMSLRAHLDRSMAAGERQHALLLCNQSLRIDPLDQELLELRVELARTVSTPHDLARYKVELQRFLS